MTEAEPIPGSAFTWRSLQIWLGLVLGIGALYLLARSVDVAELGRTLGGARLPFVALTLVASLLTPVLKALRWRKLLEARAREGCGQEVAPGVAGTMRLAGLVVIGQAVNFLVPGRWGELVRTYIAGQELACGPWFVLGSVAAEKLIDLVILAVLVAVLVPFVALPAGLAHRSDLVIILAVLVTAAAGGALAGRRYLLKASERLLRLLPDITAARWQARISESLDGLSGLGSRRVAGPIWGWSLLFWAAAAVTNLLLLVAFGLPASPVMALVLLAVLQGGVAVPSTPGKIGVFQLLCIGALAVFGVPEATGFAYGLVLHVLVVGSITAWAALALWRRSWNLRRLAQASLSWQTGKVSNE